LDSLLQNGHKFALQRSVVLVGPDTHFLRKLNGDLFDGKVNYLPWASAVFSTDFYAVLAVFGP
jgi:hypothetical protein